MKALVIVMNSLHLGYIGCYGNQWIETPALDSLASEGVVFDQHFADQPDAAGARRAWRTGCHDLQRLGSNTLPIAAVPADLQHLLKRQGIETHLLLDSKPPAGADFLKGWSEVHWSESREDVFNGAYGVLDELRIRDNWLAWLELSALLPPWNLTDEAALMYFEPAADEEGEVARTEPESMTPLVSPELGFVVPTDDRTFLRLQRTYAAAVTELDGGLGSLLEALDKSNSLDDALIILTSDRGLPLGEHGVVGYVPPLLHDELVHVPLIVRLPKSAQAGRRLLTPTQSVDLMPTLLEAFGSASPPIDGRSLWPLLRGEQIRVREYAFSVLRLESSLEAAIRTPEWCYVSPRTVTSDGPERMPQLFVKPDDRWEVNNVAHHHAELAESLERTLRDFAKTEEGVEP